MPKDIPLDILLENIDEYPDITCDVCGSPLDDNGNCLDCGDNGCGLQKLVNDARA